MPRLCSSALVTINVGDFNDEVPKFDLDTYTVDVCDDALLGLPLVQPVATDRDSGSNAAITYSLVVSYNYSNAITYSSVVSYIVTLLHTR